MSTLTIQNLRKSYKKNTVVKNVSLKIASGQIVGLLGPNGAGKTTTFRQKMQGSDEYIEGKALRIEYDGHMDKIHLYEKAFVKRGDDEVWGDYIMYDATSEFAQALSRKDESGSETKKGRTKAIIKPKK